jgi:hypothetical protein
MQVVRVESVPTVAEFTALGAEAEFAHVLHAGRAITVALSQDDEDFLGLPGLLSPEQTAQLLASRDAELRRRVPLSQAEEMDEALQPSTWRELDSLRKEIHYLVGRFAGRSGRKHSDIHVETRKAVPGPPSASASLDTLVARRDYLLGKVS